MLRENVVADCLLNAPRFHIFVLAQIVCLCKDREQHSQLHSKDGAEVRNSSSRYPKLERCFDKGTGNLSGSHCY